MQGAWQPRHDRVLIQGILKHGYGRWSAIARDTSLALNAILRAELAIAPLTDTARPFDGRLAGQLRPHASRTPLMEAGAAAPSEPVSLTTEAGAAAMPAATPPSTLAKAVDLAGFMFRGSQKIICQFFDVPSVLQTGADCMRADRT